AGLDVDIHAAVTSTGRYIVKAPFDLDVAIAGTGAEVAVEVARNQPAIARTQVDVAPQTRRFDATVTSGNVEPAFPRGADRDLSAAVEVHADPVTARHAGRINLHAVSILVIVQTEASVADRPVFGADRDI